MVAISDTTALICLSKISALWLFSALADKIIVARSVMDEIAQKSDGVANDIKSNPMFEIKSAKNQKLFREIAMFLDAGESESMAIALELKGILVIDEKKGRTIAKDLGVKTIGTVGLIALAFKKGMIDSQKAVETYEQLGSVGFRTTDELKNWLMKNVGA